MKKLEAQKFSLDAIELTSDPPEEILLLKAGWNDTKKGRFLFDEASAEMVMAAHSKDGRDLIPFDIGHGMLSGTDAERHKAAGWFKPEVRDGNLLASSIEWTPSTFEALSNREYRFHSPALYAEKESRRVTSLINVALTNIPATNNQTPIVLDSKDINGEEPQKARYDMKLVALLGVTEDKIEETVAQLHADHAALVEEKAELSIKFAEAEAKLTALEVASAKVERQSQIDALSAEGKLSPAQHQFAASLDAATFEAFKETLSTVVKTDKQELLSVEDTLNQLSEVERNVCIQLGVSEADFIARKAGK